MTERNPLPALMEQTAILRDEAEFKKALSQGNERNYRDGSVHKRPARQLWTRIWIPRLPVMLGGLRRDKNGSHSGSRPWQHSGQGPRPPLGDIGIWHVLSKQAGPRCIRAHLCGLGTGSVAGDTHRSNLRLLGDNLRLFHFMKIASSER